MAAGDGNKQVKKKPIVIYEPMPAAERERLDSRRRETDGVAELPDGFHLVGRGRSGMLYYREGENVLELGWEISGTRPGISLYLSGLDEWVLPARAPTSDADRERLRAALDRWPGLRNNGVTLVSADDLVRPWEDE